MKIYYGITNQWMDVTDICLSALTIQHQMDIPKGDSNRAVHFTDPLPGILKSIMIEHDGVVTEYDHETTITVDLQTNAITTTHEHMLQRAIDAIHARLTINHGTFHQELPEQKMAVRYITGKEKVLELGGNIGRNSLVIASMLEDSANLVTLECDPQIAAQLTENRDLNGLMFHIECSALSKRTLIQKGWETIPSDTLQEGYQWVHTITFDGLKDKYNMEFDTLVLDCEGAFYYIVKDMPEMLEKITLIIMENDYGDASHKHYVDEILRTNHFHVAYQESGGWGPCSNNFFEVWKK